MSLRFGIPLCFGLALALVTCLLGIRLYITDSFEVLVVTVVGWFILSGLLLHRLERGHWPWHFRN